MPPLQPKPGSSAIINQIAVDDIDTINLIREFQLGTIGKRLTAYEIQNRIGELRDQMGTVRSIKNS